MTTPEPNPPLPQGRAPSRRSARGALTVLAMFALGGAVLWGLFQARRVSSPRSPDVPWGAPARTLRAVTVDCGWQDQGADGPGLTPEELLPQLRAGDADFVFFQGVRSEDAVALAEGLGMQRWFHPRLYQALGPRPRGPVGCLILSKHPLYDATPVLARTPGGGCVGVRAVAVVDGVRFCVATGKGIKRWDEALGDGSSPVVVASDSIETMPKTSRPWKVFARAGLQPPGGRGLWADLVPAEDAEEKR